MKRRPRRAVLIGCSSFDDKESLPKLTCPENDIDGFEELLLEFGGFKSTDIDKLKSPKSQDALKIIQDHIDGSQRGDLRIIYYSGHGLFPEPKSDLYLATKDTIKGSESAANSIPFSEIWKRIAKPALSNKIALILDCCYSGAVGKVLAKKTEEINSLYILTACSHDETAKEDECDEHEYSIFTRHILFGIWEGKADFDGDSEVSLDDVHRYVAEKVAGKYEQTPVRWSLNVEDKGFIFARTNKSAESPKRAFSRYIDKKMESLDSDLFPQVKQAIRDRRPKIYDLVCQLYIGDLTIGEFTGEWRRIERAEQRHSLTDDINGIPLKIIFVSGRTFWMGSSDDVGYDNERPRHEVTIPNFYISQYLITQEQWEAVMGTNPSYFKGKDRPVERVSWKEAKEFCDRLSQINGKGRKYRLPSEAEWEYACRAGVIGDYANDLNVMAWYRENSGWQTHQVGQKQPNAFDLFDMLGNVYEWCEDVWHDGYKKAPKNGSAWDGENIDRRVVRGGSWDTEFRDCRPAFRYSHSFGGRSVHIGVRVVASIETSSP